MTEIYLHFRCTHYGLYGNAPVLGASISRVLGSLISAIVGGGGGGGGTAIKATISKVELFSALDPEDLQSMADAMAKEEFKDGDAIITQDEACDDDSKFYIVETGRCARARPPHPCAGQRSLAVLSSHASLCACLRVRVQLIGHL